MEEKNEEIEINQATEVVDKRKKKSFYKKIIGLVKFCFTLLGVAFIALIITAYYRSDVRDIVKETFPNARIPEKFAHKNEPKTIVMDSQNNVEAMNVSPVLMAMGENAPKKEEISAAVNDEKPVEKTADVSVPSDKKEVSENTVKEPLKTEESIVMADEKALEEDQKATEIVVTEVVSDNIGEVKFEEMKVNPQDVKALDEETKNKIADAVKNMASANNFSNSSFDPVVKSLEKVPADKYSALPLEEKFLDLMNKNSELVAIVGEMSNRIARLETTKIDPMLISAMIDKIENVGSKVAVTPKDDAKSALVIASSFLRYAVLEGRNFVYELDTMKLLSSTNNAITDELKKLEEFSEKGIKTLAELENEFKDAISKADGYITASEAGDLKGKILDKVNELIVIKRIDGKPVSERLMNFNDKVIPLIKNGNIKDALALANEEDVKVKEYLNVFVLDAENASKATDILNKINSLVADNFKAGLENNVSEKK